MLFKYHTAQVSSDIVVKFFFLLKKIFPLNRMQTFLKSNLKNISSERKYVLLAENLIIP